SKLIYGSAPRTNDPPEKITTYVVEHRDRIVMASAVFAAAMVLIVWFAATLGAIYQRAGSSGGLPGLVLSGFVMLAAPGIFFSPLLTGAAYAIDAHPALRPLAVAPYTVLTIASTVAGESIALPLVAAAIATVHTGAFPQWLAWLALLAAATKFVSAFAAGSSG